MNAEEGRLFGGDSTGESDSLIRCPVQFGIWLPLVVACISYYVSFVCDMVWIHIQVFFLILVFCFGRAVPTELGSMCSRDNHCKVENSYCSSGVCTCRHYHAQWNSTTCLESKLLGRECVLSEQCFLRVANSMCKDGRCHCSPGFVRFRKHTCLGPAKVGDVCYSDEHCRLWTENSHCKFLIPKLFGKCICDGEGHCTPDGPSNVSVDSYTAVDTFEEKATTKISVVMKEGESPEETPERESDGNRKPEETKVLFVDPFLPQKVHLQEPFPRPFDIYETKDAIENTESKEVSSTHLSTDTTIEKTTTAEELGHGNAAKPLSENSKYRVEHPEKVSDGYGEKWSEVDAVSLGYPCHSDVECQKRDVGSLCLNGVCDCAIKENGSDSCGRNSTGCSPETFQCRNSGLCISWFFVCDGRSDCPDSSDENCAGPECPEPSLRCGTSGPCVSLASVCDGVKNCPNGEDEHLCSLSERNATQGCPYDSFQCADGECLPKFEFCNALPKCSDGSDEFPHLCSSQVKGRRLGGNKHCPFECGNGRCRSTAIVCSGRDGCGDNSDEAHCSVCHCPAISATN